MPTIRLTQAAVDRLRPPAEGRVEYWDSTLPGFGLRVSAPRQGSKAGRKTWQVMYRIKVQTGAVDPDCAEVLPPGGKPKSKLVRETIGTVAEQPDVEKAREKAKESINKAKAGIDPAKERERIAVEERRAAAAEEARRRDTVAVILDRYVAEHGAKRWRPDTLREVKRAFEVDIKPMLGARPVRDIVRRDVRQLLDAIVERGRAPHAHHVLAYLRPALNWAVEKEIIDANPAEGIPDPDPRRREARSRDRYLDDDEIRLFWLGCDKLGWPFGPLFKLLLVTGQRRDELSEARWSEFDLDKALWTLPRERVKNDKAHLVHLSSLALEIIAALPKIGTKGFLFTTTGQSPVSGFGRARDRLAAVMLDIHRAELTEAGNASEAETATIKHFVIHDLRRTAATGMAGIGIPHHVLDRVLNHTGGKISGVGAIYNRFEYLDERKAALEAWSRHVESLVRPLRSNVVGLPRRQRR